MTLRQLLEDIQAAVAANPQIADRPVIVQVSRARAEVGGVSRACPAGHTSFYSRSDGRDYRDEEGRPTHVDEYGAMAHDACVVLSSAQEE